VENKMKSVLTIHYQNQVVSTVDIEHDSDIKSFTFGRAADNDIIVNSAIVSGHHAVFEIKNNKLVIRDLDSTNGIYVNEKMVKEQVLLNGDTIRIDDISAHDDNGVMIVYSMLESNSDERWSEFKIEGKQTVTIGREKDNDIVLTHNSISKHHTRITKVNDGFFIEDLNSTNGTHVNGKMLTSKLKLKDFDTIFIGNSKIIFREEKLTYNVLSKGLRIDAIHISKFIDSAGIPFIGKKKRKKILDDISISIKAGELVALIGGSGAGKSTFMDSLNGFRLPSEGSVLINGDDFYANYNSYKNIVGYVPQQDIVYDTLSVNEMLTYASRLRMPDDSSEEEISKRVRDVIYDVELDGREDVIIKQLSGGQRKRASIAVELLADPKLFFLDEPTSGLDPGMERNMMRLLRKLADKGKTIILVTHATANLQMCDKVVILGTGGKLCYYGPSDAAIQFFEVKEYADIYDLINKESDKWQALFRKSKFYSYFNILEKKTGSRIRKREISGSSPLKQFIILTGRYLKLTIKDKQRIFFIIMQAPLIGLLLSYVVEKDPFRYYETAKQIIFPLACTGVWVGVLNSIQEICKERTVYKRERAVNLKLLPYIMSKMVVLSVICLIQTGLLTGIFTTFITQPDYNLTGSIRFEIFITLFLATYAATSMGIAISALVSNSDRAMGIAPMVLIPQLIFTGLVFSLKGTADFIADLALSKWATRALAISFDLNGRPLKAQVESPDIPFPKRDLPEVYNHQLDLLYKNWIILFAFSLICIVLALIFLKRQDEK